MAKKAVASLQKRGAKDFTKVIKMTKNQKMALIHSSKRLFIKIK